MPAKKTAVSKSAFIRSQPATLSAAEVVAKAQAQGMKLSKNYVYRLRTASNAAARKMSSAPAVPRAARKAPAVPRPLNTPSSAEDLLRAVAAEVGLGRAIELLQGERARVHSILRG